MSTCNQYSHTPCALPKMLLYNSVVLEFIYWRVSVIVKSISYWRMLLTSGETMVVKQ